MLQHLGSVARQARLHADLRQIDIATTARMSHATVSRFETGQAWPQDPDRLIAAYAEETSSSAVSFWARALTAWQDQ